MTSDLRTSGRHHELGTIARATVKRNVGLGPQPNMDGRTRVDETVAGTEAGLDVRPLR